MPRGEFETFAAQLSFVVDIFNERSRSANPWYRPVLLRLCILSSASQLLLHAAYAHL